MLVFVCVDSLWSCLLSFSGVFCRTGGGTLAMDACSTSAASGDGRTSFALSPNGQLKMPRMGNYCLTLVGHSPSSADIAQAADIAATSSNSQHVVKNIVDGDASSFWASGDDPAAPIDVQLDFGGTQQIYSMEIDWEHPALVCAASFVLAWASMRFLR